MHARVIVVRGSQGRDLSRLPRGGGARESPAARRDRGILVLIRPAEQRRPQALVVTAADRVGLGEGGVTGDRASRCEDLGLRLLISGEGGPSAGRCTVLPSGNNRASWSRVMRGQELYASRIDVDEGRPRGRVIADAALLQMHRDLAHALDGHVGQVRIHGLAEHVLAVLGDEMGASPKHGVGFRRSITGDRVERLLGARLLMHLPEDVEKARAHRGWLVATPVAQQPAQLLDALRVIDAVALESDGGTLVGMDVHDGDGARIAIRIGAFERDREKRERGREREDRARDAQRHSISD